MNRERQVTTSPRRRWPLRRFVVAEDSMAPTLVAGQGLVATPWSRPKSGQIRVFEHPHRSEFWLVKRVVAVDGTSMIVASDNDDAVGAVDSTTFGPVDVAGSYRVVARIPRRWM